MWGITKRSYEFRRCFTCLMDICGGSSIRPWIALAAGSPDLLIGALDMSHGGASLLRAVSERVAGRLTAVALIDDRSGDDVVRAEAAGYHACIARTGSADELFAAIVSAFRTRAV